MAKEEKAPAEKAPVESEARKNFAKLIETYKKQNPVKYEAKKKALEAKLASL